MRSRSKRAAALVLAVITALSALVLSASATAGEAPVLTGETASARESWTLADGVVRTHIKTPSGSIYKQQDINVVEIDLSKRSIHFDVSYPQNNAAMLETTNAAVTRFAAEHAELTPVVAFNADMWMVDYAQARILGSGVSYLGYSDPVVKKQFPISRSFNIVDGEIYTSETIPQETPFSGVSMSFGVTDDYVPVMGNPSLDITISSSRGTTFADGLNRLPANNALIMYSDRVMGAVTDFALDDAYEIVVECGEDYTPAHGASITGTVAAIYRPSDAANPGPITNTQFVLTARGDRVSDLAGFAVGDELTVDMTVVDLLGDDARWQRVINCVGGNFALAVNGTPTTPLPLLNQTYPATIIGSDRNGKLMFVTIDGRQPGYSDGLEMYGSDQLMRDLGFYNALLLDGGGSTSVVVADPDGGFVTVNRPSDTDGAGNHVDRAVNDSVIISVGPDRSAQGEIDPATGAGFNADPVELRFDSRSKVQALVGDANEAQQRFLNGELKLKASGLATNDPFVYVRYSNIRTKLSAGTYKAAALVYRIPLTASRSNFSTEIFFNTNGQGARAGQSVTAATVRSGKYESAVFNAASLTGWTGTVSSLRLDFFALASEGDEMDVYAIVLAENASQARSRAKAIADGLNAPPTTTVTFEMNGHGTQIAPQTVPRGESPVRPDDPFEAGWIFEGWYVSSAMLSRYNFDTVPTKDMKLWAKWIEDSGLAGDADGDGNLNAADVIIIMRYLVGWRDEGVILAHFDYNGDSKINNRDVIMLMLSIVNE